MCGSCWVSIPLPWDSLTVCCVMKKKVRNVKKKPQFECVASAQYASRGKNCIVHVQQLSLCVKCCHICGFIRKHLATVKLVLTMPPRQSWLTLKGDKPFHGSQTTFTSEKWPEDLRSPTQLYGDWINVFSPQGGSRRDTGMDAPRRRYTVITASSKDRLYKPEMPLPAPSGGSWERSLTWALTGKPSWTIYMLWTSVPVA